MNESGKKRILITGLHSYIGQAFSAYACEHYQDSFLIENISLRTEDWKNADFSPFDTVFHVAGIAQSDVGKVTEETKQEYYSVNTDLAVQAAQKAKADGVRQFVFMSSMHVYGDCAKYGHDQTITSDTVPNPSNVYGDSKWQAEQAVRAMEDSSFRVAVLRSPMIYGKGSKGNYPTLSKFAKKLPLFPLVENERSMLYIDNLCEFLCRLMLSGRDGIFFPQNSEYASTGKMVQQIAAASGHRIWVTPLLRPAVSVGSRLPGRIGLLVNKAFGSIKYEQSMSEYPGMDYRVVGQKESILRTEAMPAAQKHILIVSQYFYPETFRINDIACEWVKRGYRVTVLTGIPNYPAGKFFDGYGYTKKRRETWNGVEIIRIPLIPRGNSAAGMIANYGSFVISGFLKNLLSDVSADLVFTYEVSPMTQALIGCWYAQKHRVPHYLYVQDLWPENVEAVTGISNPAVIRPIGKMADYIYSHTDEIFMTSPSLVKAVCERGVPERKVHYWPQYAEDFYRPVARTPNEIPDDGCFRIAFTGNIGTAQGLDILPRAAELLGNENVRFVLIGDGRYLAELEADISGRGLSSVFQMIPWQEPGRIPGLLAACDAAFVSFQASPLWDMTIPAKLQSYMACGMPIIASASGETKRIIEEAGCGICCQIGSAEKLAEGIRTIMKSDLAAMGRNSRKYCENHFHKARLMDEMDAYLKTI